MKRRIFLKQWVKPTLIILPASLYSGCGWDWDNNHS
jgi:hypothetical protein